MISGRNASGGPTSSPKETFQYAVQQFQYGGVKKAEALLVNLLKLVAHEAKILYMPVIIFLEINHPDAA